MTSKRQRSASTKHPTIARGLPAAVTRGPALKRTHHELLLVRQRITPIAQNRRKQPTRPSQRKDHREHDHPASKRAPRATPERSNCPSQPQYPIIPPIVFDAARHGRPTRPSVIPDTNRSTPSLATAIPRGCGSPTPSTFSSRASAPADTTIDVRLPRNLRRAHSGARLPFPNGA